MDDGLLQEISSFISLSTQILQCVGTLADASRAIVFSFLVYWLVVKYCNFFSEMQARSPFDSWPFLQDVAGSTASDSSATNTASQCYEARLMDSFLHTLFLVNSGPRYRATRGVGPHFPRHWMLGTSSTGKAEIASIVAFHWNENGSVTLHVVRAAGQQQQLCRPYSKSTLQTKSDEEDSKAFQATSSTFNNAQTINITTVNLNGPNVMENATATSVPADVLEQRLAMMKERLMQVEIENLKLRNQNLEFRMSQLEQQFRQRIPPEPPPVSVPNRDQCHSSTTFHSSFPNSSSLFSFSPQTDISPSPRTLNDEEPSDFWLYLYLFCYFFLVPVLLLFLIRCIVTPAIDWVRR
ncbi:hypothetical protein D9758_017486 [Tetrapyrgos nigripes]|uniref:Uncharacterized protein n=1 Tax=Tetrapyrgos nigripes TaxID=182062 RepID=A0A8H5C3H7_9AGAR|nr:hypothetical protein D9758_017486 [Tetrapyrgos nigripes]